jgi:Flp pilus assembly protein TadD
MAARAPDAPAGGPARLRAGIAVALLVAATLAAYWPALGASWIWDDDSYILENPAVQRPDGILHAWVPGATPQWYPMVFASFWVQHAIHGLEPFGYHLVNVLLHAASGVMLWRLLVALRLPGAPLAAGLFLLHPVQVESVAWVTERKNVLSMAFALASVLAWTRFLGDGRPFAQRAGTLGAAFLLFVLAMLSKTTAVAVPVAMAAIAWWRPGGRDGARRIAALLVPFFALGAAMGLFTAHVEATHVGARGPEFERDAVERLLHASRAWWEYLRLWAWPADRCFVHPAFTGGAAAGWAAFGAGLAAAAAAVLAARRGVRGAMVAFLAFSAGVFPALGFVNLFPLRFAPVADHFMYVATVPLAAATAWAACRALRAGADASPSHRARAAVAASAAALAALGAISFAEAGTYRDAETLWRVTLARNPDAWLASNNLATILLRRSEAAADAGDAASAAGLLAECEALMEPAVRLAGAIDMPVQSNMSEVRRLQGRLPEALAALDEAIRIQPEAPGPHWQRGRVVELLGRMGEAGPEYLRAVELSPRSPLYLRELARWQAKSGRVADARGTVERIVALDPGDAEAVANLGSLALEQGDVPAARLHLLRALAGGDRELSATVAPRAVRALLAPPADEAAVREAVAIASGLVRLTEGADPISLVLLARAQAAAGDAASGRASLERADALLRLAPAEVRDAIAPERAAAEASLAAPSVPATPPG